MTEGGAYDAGYWDFAAKPLTEAERFRVQLGADVPTPGPAPDFAAASWPQARKDLALRKYSAQYALVALLRSPSSRASTRRSRSCACR